jgi:hypothetical protein
MITGSGLAWWHAWLCVWIGYFIAACFICLTGRIGATYHISFPVMCRASFGIWGSLWPVFNRAGKPQGPVRLIDGADHYSHGVYLGMWMSRLGLSSVSRPAITASIPMIRLSRH